MHFLDAQSATHCKVKLAGSGGVEEERMEGGMEEREGWKREGWKAEGERGRGGRGREVKKRTMVNSRVQKN